MSTYLSKADGRPRVGRGSLAKGGLAVMAILMSSMGVPVAAEVEKVALRVANPFAVALRGASVTSGVPMPRGALERVENVRLTRRGVEVPVQCRAAGRWWPATDIRWLLVDFQVDIGAGEEQQYELECGAAVEPVARPRTGVAIAREGEDYGVDTGAAVFRISGARFTLFEEVKRADGTVVVAPPAAGAPGRGAVVRGLRPTVTRAIPEPGNRGKAHLIYGQNLGEGRVEDYRLRFVDDQEYEVVGALDGPVGRGRYRQDFTSADGRLAIPADAWLNEALPAAGDGFTFRALSGGELWSEGIFEVAEVEGGPLRRVLRVKGCFGPVRAPVLEFTAWYHFHAGSARVELDFTLENNQFGGRTDTGNARNAAIGGVNCAFFEEMELVLPLALGADRRVRLLGEVGAASVQVEGVAEIVELYQDSNGGENWDRYRAPEFYPRPNSYVRFRGYRIFSGSELVGQGDRAAGLLDLGDGRGGLLAGVADFWQNFPKALAATPEGGVRVGLFPGRYAGDFPLRSGEHKTHRVLLDFYQGEVQDGELAAVAGSLSRPLRAEPPPTWEGWNGGLGYVYPVDARNFPDYERFNRSTVGIFEAGREPGTSLLSRREEFDFYGWMDYGDVPIDFESGTGQWGMKYDLDYHLARQYARSLEPRWFELFAAAVRHASDIDVHHQPHYPGLHFVKGGTWAHSLHDEPGHLNPNRNYNHFTKDLAFGARGAAAFHYLTGDWKAYEVCLELAENALAQYMSPPEAPDPAQRNRMGWRGDACTLERLLEGYLLSGEKRFLERARWVVKDCAFDGRPAEHEPVSLWSSTFYMMALARYVELFPEDQEAKKYLLAHLETLYQGCQGETCMCYTVTPQADGSVVGEGTTSMYNIMGADALTVAYLLTGEERYLKTARRCFAYGVRSLNWGEEKPAFAQVHTASGAMHGNLFMRVEAELRDRR